MSQGDPTDQALAAIASILDHPADGRDATSETESGDLPARAATASAEASATDAEAQPADRSSRIEGYSRIGPGPIDAIRFQWTARRDDAGRYYVDETVGPNSRPISTGPIPEHDVMTFIDDRERAARARFAALRNEITTGALAAPYRSERGDVS